MWDGRAMECRSTVFRVRSDPELRQSAKKTDGASLQRKSDSRRVVLSARWSDAWCLYARRASGTYWCKWRHGVRCASSSGTRRLMVALLFTPWNVFVAGPVIHSHPICMAVPTGSIGCPSVAQPQVGALRKVLNDHRDLAIAAVAWLVVNCIVVGGLLQSYSTERKYYSTLRSLESDTKALQARDASPQEWQALRTRIKQTLAPIVVDLRKTAAANEPIRQHLLWAVRINCRG